jgi:[amino group carrier protein]-lysine/ornithine hydrolase
VRRKKAGSETTSLGPGGRVRLLLDSLKIYSPTGAERALGSYLAERMERLGYSRVRTDRAGNVIGETGTGRTRLLLCGHMDTIPGRLQVRRTGGSILGRGAADAKSPLCALLVAGAESADSGLRVTFAGVTQEEGEGAGIEHLIRSGVKADFAVFGEPGGADRITVGYRGRVSLNVSVKTQGGHAGSPWAYRSAYDVFNSVLSRLKQYESSVEVQGDRFRSLSMTPTLVNAGTFANVVPNNCQSTIDLRLPPSISSSEALSQIRSAVKEAGEGARVRVAAGEPTEAYEADISSPLVRAFQRGVILQLKTPPKLIRKTSTGDMNTFAHKTRTECLTYGPGLSGTSHTDGETVLISDYLGSIDVLKEAFKQLAAMAPGDSE